MYKFLKELYLKYKRAKRIARIHNLELMKRKQFKTIHQATYTLKVDYEDDYFDTYFAIVNFMKNELGERDFVIVKSTYPKQYKDKLQNQLKVAYEFKNGKY